MSVQNELMRHANAHSKVVEMILKPQKTGEEERELIPIVAIGS